MTGEPSRHPGSFGELGGAAGLNRYRAGLASHAGLGPDATAGRAVAAGAGRGLRGAAARPAAGRGPEAIPEIELAWVGAGLVCSDSAGGPAGPARQQRGGDGGGGGHDRGLAAELAQACLYRQVEGSGGGAAGVDGLRLDVHHRLHLAGECESHVGGHRNLAAAGQPGQRELIGAEVGLAAHQQERGVLAGRHPALHRTVQTAGVHDVEAEQHHVQLGQQSRAVAAVTALLDNEPNFLLVHQGGLDVFGGGAGVTGAVAALLL